MGFMDVSGLRYFDIREIDRIFFPVTIHNKWYLQLIEVGIEKVLPSDSLKRKDSSTLKTGDFVIAQAHKEELEEL